MNTCQSCGCNPCACPGPTALANARLIDPVITGGEWIGGALDGATLNGGTSNGQQINAAVIDCTTLVCTQPPGTCNGTVASTGFVCSAIDGAITAANPAFCTAVQLCIAAAPALCTEIINCINTNPGSINNPIAFDPAVFATTLQAGVIRIASLGELQGASCGLAIDPCTLEAFWNAGGPNTLWTSFENAVNAVLATAPGFCAQVFACGVAPLNNPIFTGDPQAPTPPLADNDTSIATTAFVNSFVNAALGNSISALNPAFCAAVAACGAGAGNFASANLSFSLDGGGNVIPLSVAVTANYGCIVAVGAGLSINVTFTIPQPDTNYVVSTMTNIVGGFSFGWNDVNPTRASLQTVAGVTNLGVDYVIPGDPNSSHVTTFVFQR